MHELRLSLLALAALLAAFVGAALVAGAAPGDALSGGAATSAATLTLDANNTVEIRPSEGPNGRYASLDANNELVVDFRKLNRHGLTRADEVFVIDADTNQRMEARVTSDSDHVRFYWGSDPSSDAATRTVIREDGKVAVGVELTTEADVRDAGFTIEVGPHSGSLGPGGEVELGYPEEPMEWTVPNAGEPVDLTIPLRNDAIFTVRRTVTMTVDDEPADEQDVEIPAESRREVTFEHTFPAPGTYEIGVDGNHVGTVTVHSDALEVHNASLSRQAIRPGESVAVSAAVTNHGDEAQTLHVDLTVGGAVVERQTIRVPAGETVEVGFERTFERKGSYDVSVAGADAGTVHVDSPTGVAVRRYGAEHGPLLGVLSIPTLGAAIAFGRRRVAF